MFNFSWYVGDMSRQRAESLLKQNDKEGCFVVRKSSTKGLYTLSLHTKVPQSHVKHYHIKQNARAEFYLSEKHCCETIPDLINYHRHNSGGLACRLKVSPCDRPVPPTAGLSHGMTSFLLTRIVKNSFKFFVILIFRQMGNSSFRINDIGRTWFRTIWCCKTCQMARLY